MPEIIISFKDKKIKATLNESETAKKIFNALPLKITANLWGDEIYSKIPVKTGLEKNAAEEVEPGTLAYWPPGQAICIFFGKTPASTSEKPRAASKVNLIGKTQQPEAFKLVKEGDSILINRKQ